MQGSPEFEFSTDRDRIDGDWVHAMLSGHAYWTAGRTREVQDTANAGSRCYGVYARSGDREGDQGGDRGGEQVAFARVVTDGATFAWLCDVIVDPGQRGKSIGKLLMAGIVADLEPLDLKRTLLATDDAHTLYAQFGWGPLRKPANWMERPA